jgi:hypothetical protein
MELMTLDSNFQPNNLVERYGSLIWTERYSSAGDFQLVTTDVERTLKALPLESFVTIRESTVPMLVEVHKIEKKPGAAPVLTVVGRSFETVLERRAASNTKPTGIQVRAAWMISIAKESDAAYVAMREVLGDIARPPFFATPPFLSPLDAIPEIDLTLPADLDLLATNTFEIKPGNLYSTVLELLTTNHHGLKAVRPVLGGTKIGIEIYNGADLTDTVVFDAKFEQFDAATYLLSQQGSSNVAYIYGSNGADTVLKTTAPEPSGLARRVLMMDLVSDTTSGSSDVRRTRGLNELYKFNATALFDGQVSQQVASSFNKDYFLGDIIRLDGEYGLSEFVRVAEFIRSDDATGSKAYPTFEVVTD